jgi:hypothetical protein
MGRLLRRRWALRPQRRLLRRWMVTPFSVSRISSGPSPGHPSLTHLLPTTTASKDTATATHLLGPASPRQMVRAAIRTCTTAPAPPLARAAPPTAGAATRPPTARRRGASLSSAPAPPATSPSTARAAQPTATRRARAPTLGAAALWAATVVTPPTTVAWGARLDLETAPSPPMSRLTAGVVPSMARPAPGPPLATAVRRAATAAVPLTTAASGVSPPLAPAIAVVVTSRRMAGAVQTGRRARGRPLEPAAPRRVTAETRQTIAAPGARSILAPALIPSRPMASVARSMGGPVLARGSAVVARPLAPVETRQPTAVRDGKMDLP